MPTTTRIYKRREPSCPDSPDRMRWLKNVPLLFFRPLSFHVSIKNVTAGKSRREKKEEEKKVFFFLCVTLCGWFSSCFWFAIKRATRSLSFYAPCPLCRIEFPPWRQRMLPIQVHTIYKENKSFFIKIVLYSYILSAKLQSYPLLFQEDFWKKTEGPLLKPCFSIWGSGGAPIFIQVCCWIRVWDWTPSENNDPALRPVCIDRLL